MGGGSPRRSTLGRATPRRQPYQRVSRWGSSPGPGQLLIDTRRTMTADAQTLIDDLVRAPGETMTRLRAAPAGVPLVEALALAPDAHTRMLVCDLLGFRKEAGGIDALISCLEDESAKVRSSAADALAKIGDTRAGAPIYARVALPEPDPGARRMFVAALGAVGYRPATPLLTDS